MPLKNLFLLVIVLTIVSCGSKENNTPEYSEADIKQYQWEKAKMPTSKEPKVYGGYTGGCIDGALRLPEFGTGYIAANAKNNRLYGHPDLIQVIEDLAKEMNGKYNTTLLIGDLSQARGGPAPLDTSAHRSHQTGLDVDIWYRNLSKEKIEEDDIYPHTVLSFFKDKLNKKYWGDSQIKMLEYAAKNDDVERILVNPVVKKAMCEKFGNEPWIHKLRPWWGHDKHFHLRLKCPKNDSTCSKQDPVPDENSCSEPLNWWFSDEANNMGKSNKSTKRQYPNLPQQCEKVWVWKPIGTIKLQP
ncbi:MAG: penicillin-insensitive murein endopeptidase [Alphaproteobacteria bacterium CG11_big_fil_rev_8_21_14_0_20_39_49]|nr:MAG: penicillin-insensitive murein endopeptidase [Alphaproteobacteria bacterium CG11_big_fil_rev_8_21_14_0_20_39_49]